MSLPKSMQRLIEELRRLPSIGDKSATRLAYYLVTRERSFAQGLGDAIVKAAQEVSLCRCCFHLAEGELCTICSRSDRDTSVLCVVEKPIDVMHIERLGEYRGVYHVLHGLWAPMRGIGPDKLKLAELSQRLDAGGVKEIILALGATVEGDATALYIARVVAERGIRATRLAQGLPKGGELEYADDITLQRAFAGRSVLG